MKKIAILSLLTLLISSTCFSMNSAFAESSRNVFRKNNNSKVVSPNYWDENSANEYKQYIKTKEQDAFANNYQSLTQNAKQKEFSQVEKLFNGNDIEKVTNPLFQVGYNIFTAPSAGMNSTGKFDDSYKLSIGEKVSAYLYGDSVDVVAISGSNLLSPVVQTEVDSKGNIFISGIGVVPAENKSIKDVESAINRLASSKYNN